MQTMKHRSHRLCHTVERIGIAVEIRSAVSNSPTRMRDRQLAPTIAMPVAKVSQTTINHNDNHGPKMVVAKMQHTNAQKETTIAKTKISQWLTPKRQQQQVLTDTLTQYHRLLWTIYTIAIHSFQFFFLSIVLFVAVAGDSNTSNKASSTNTDNANTSGDDSNAPTNAGNTTANSSDGAVKFVEAPLPKVNAWKVCALRFSLNHLQNCGLSFRWTDER